MTYPLYNMNCDDFESMVIMICDHILGPSTIPFAKGKDGGKDGKFIGKANCIPSEAEPWNGKIIIQAKHTERLNASCSDYDFNKRLNNEVIPAIKKLKEDNNIDYYLLFTNYKLTGIKDTEIEKRIKSETNIPTLLFADEKIQDFLKTYPDVVKKAELNRLLLPFEFDETDIETVVTSLSEYVHSEQLKLKDEISFDYPGLEKKNVLNKMGKDYFDNVILSSMDDFKRIRSFLSDPENEQIVGIYEDAVSELNAKIFLHRDQYYEFEMILETLVDKVINSYASVLRRKKRLVRILLHYMYCNCDIGKKS